MNLEFLGKRFDENIFVTFLHETFDELEMIDSRYRNDNLDESDKQHITEYRYFGEAFLDDNSEIGVLLLKSKTPHIENKRVGFSQVISKLAKPIQKDTVLVVIYHEDSPVWRLTFVSYDFKDGKQTQRTNAKRYSYVLGEGIATKTAKEQIGALGRGRITQEILEDAFSVEKVSKEFFYEYKSLYKESMNYLTERYYFDEEIEKSSFTKKLLGRIVFLYFLQKKGWLGSIEKWGDGKKNFMSHLFKNRNENGNFYHDILEPVFFDALNIDRRKSDDYFELLECKMPFLNGGLFTRDKIDTIFKHEKYELDDELMTQIFDTFDKYNFTVIEDTPHDSEVAIDPEMLGRVFEDLLEDRKDKGAFYTPREIVHYMCQESIINYLFSCEMGAREALRDFVLKKELSTLDKTKLKESLVAIKVLDPAIGSGAFPMGMLHEIVSLLEIVSDESTQNLKRTVIQNSIYGVDIEPSAVEIAKLRFWLSIVVDEETPSPLPNLFYKIMVGNSLLETIDGFDPLANEQSLIGNNRKKIKNIQKLLNDFYLTANNDKKQALQETIEKEIDEILDSKLKEKRDEKESQISNVNLFNGLSKKQAEIIEKANKTIDIIENIKQRPTTELFFYKIYFADVMNNGGFNVVIGNPPYIRHEKIKAIKERLKIEGYKSYNGTADLYIYFFEQGYRLLKEGGILSYITSNKYTRARYGKQFREFVLDNTKILEYIDFKDIQIFDSATVATSIFSYKKVGNVASASSKSFTYCDVDKSYKKGEVLENFISQKGFSYPQSDLDGDGFIFMNQKELAIKKIMEKKGLILKEWNIEIKSGIKTGFNEAFIIDGKIKDELIAKNIKNSEVIKPLLRGRDVNRYEYEFADKWLINIHNNPPIDINEYPTIKEHLDKYIDKLEKRSDKGITPYNLRNCAYLDEFEKEKIMWLELTDNPKFTLDSSKYLLEMTVFFISGENLKYLLALLNSKVVFWYFNFICAESGVGTNRWKKIYVEQLPIPQISKEAQKPFEILVDYILFLKTQDLEVKGIKYQLMPVYFEQIIDGMVYELYFEELLKKHDRDIIQHLGVLPEITELADEEKISILFEVFTRLNNIKHKVRNNLFYMDSIPEIKIIKGK